MPDSAAFTELAGLPLTLMQPVCFAWAVVSRDWLSTVLFLWWGPGFLAAVVAVIVCKVKGFTIDWHPIRYAISYLCKGRYLAWGIIEHAFADISAAIGRAVVDRGWVPGETLVQYKLHAEIDAEEFFAVVEPRWSDPARRTTSNRVWS